MLARSNAVSARNGAVPSRGGAAHVSTRRHVRAVKEEPKSYSRHQGYRKEVSSSSVLPALLGLWVSALVCVVAVLGTVVTLVLTRKNKQ